MRDCALGDRRQETMGRLLCRARCSLCVLLCLCRGRSAAKSMHASFRLSRCVNIIQLDEAAQAELDDGDDDEEEEEEEEEPLDLSSLVLDRPKHKPRGWLTEEFVVSRNGNLFHSVQRFCGARRAQVRRQEGPGHRAGG